MELRSPCSHLTWEPLVRCSQQPAAPYANHSVLLRSGTLEPAPAVGPARSHHPAAPCTLGCQKPVTAFCSPGNPQRSSGSLHALPAPKLIVPRLHLTAPSQHLCTAMQHPTQHLTHPQSDSQHTHSPTPPSLAQRLYSSLMENTSTAHMVPSSSCPLTPTCSPHLTACALQEPWSHPQPRQGCHRAGTMLLLPSSTCRCPRHWSQHPSPAAVRVAEHWPVSRSIPALSALLPGCALATRSQPQAQAEHQDCRAALVARSGGQKGHGQGRHRWLGGHGGSAGCQRSQTALSLGTTTRRPS